jgi:multidrug efflux pump subunit AcrA (membrane-fusion protein)
MMSHTDYRPDPDELDDAEFEQALRALRRRRVITATSVLGALAAFLAVPWSQSVAVSGRVAPAHWARVRSEVPGVVRELKCKSGDAVQEGDVIAVLDSDEQRDAVEAARLALTRERQKLADLELRLQQNRILREGSDAAVREAERRGLAAESVEDARIEDLEPAAASVLEGVRGFTIMARNQLVIDGRTATPLRADPILRAVDAAMASYVERAEAVADHLSNGAGEDAGRELRARLDNVRFTFALSESSMREIVLKHEIVVRGLLAPVELRALVDQLERESRDLTQSFAGLASVTRGLTGSPAERREWIRDAEEKRQLLTNETERVEAERETFASSIAQAELMVRAAERNEGKTAIHAPISGTLTESQLAELDVVGPSAAVGIIEDTAQLVLKVRVVDADWPLVAEGLPVTADVDGRMLNGTVAWKVPRVGQEVRDQEWNVLVRVASDMAGIEPGTKVKGAVVVGRRSLFGRLLDRRQRGEQSASVAGTRMAFVNDPTEERAVGALGELAATDVAPGTPVTDPSEAADRN